MTEMTLTRTHQLSPEIKQSRLKRDWMDDTYNKHAYRCLPLSAANVNGWEIILQKEIVAIWDGGMSVPRIISDDSFNGRTIANCNKIGMIDIHIGWAFGTEQGFDTVVTGSPNFFIDGIEPLTALIPSSWWPDEVQMTWRFTAPGKEVVLPEGMPFAFFYIQPSHLLEEVNFKIKNLWDDNELIEKRMSYSDAKMKKQIDEPWTWMNGIRTGLNERGEQIGPRHDGLIQLSEPKIPEVNNGY